MPPPITKFQIGKNGITPGVIESLSLAFKHHKQIRISVLKSACRDRIKLKEMAQELAKRSPVRCDAKIIGYTIILIKRGKLAGKTRNSKLFKKN